MIWFNNFETNVILDTSKKKYEEPFDNTGKTPVEKHLLCNKKYLKYVSIHNEHKDSIEIVARLLRSMFLFCRISELGT